MAAVSAALISLAIILFYKQKGVFTTAFVILFISLPAALFVQMLFDNVCSRSSLIEVLQQKRL